MVAREARPKVARREVYKFAAQQRIIMITGQSSLIFHYDILGGLAHKSTTDYLTKTNFEKVYVPFWRNGSEAN